MKNFFALAAVIISMCFEKYGSAQLADGNSLTLTKNLQFDQTTDRMFPPEDTETPRNWHYLLEPYMMFPNMNGTVGLGNLPDSDVNEDPSDVFSNLQRGAMLYGEAYSKYWA